MAATRGKDPYYPLAEIKEVCKETDDFTDMQNRMMHYFNGEMNDSNRAIEKKLLQRVANIPHEPRCWTILDIVEPAADFLLEYTKLNPDCFTVSISENEWKTFLVSEVGRDLSKFHLRIPHSNKGEQSMAIMIVMLTRRTLKRRGALAEVRPQALKPWVIARSGPSSTATPLTPSPLKLASPACGTVREGRHPQFKISRSINQAILTVAMPIDMAPKRLVTSANG